MKTNGRIIPPLMNGILTQLRVINPPLPQCTLKFQNEGRGCVCVSLRIKKEWGSYMYKEGGNKYTFSNAININQGNIRH